MCIQDCLVSQLNYCMFIVLILDPVRMRDEYFVTMIYSVHEHDFESRCLWDVNCENSCISLAVSLYLFQGHCYFTVKI